MTHAVSKEFGGWDSQRKYKCLVFYKEEITEVGKFLWVNWKKKWQIIGRVLFPYFSEHKGRMPCISCSFNLNYVVIIETQPGLCWEAVNNRY